MDPLFWLGLSILLVAVSLTALLFVAIPAFQELGRAARSAEKLFDTLNRELPPTLESIRLTGLEITELTEDVSDGVQSAGRVVKQVDDSLHSARQQAKRAQLTGRSVAAGVRAAWRTFTRSAPAQSNSRRSTNRLPPTSRPPLDLREERTYYSSESASSAEEEMTSLATPSREESLDSPELRNTNGWESPESLYRVTNPADASSPTDAD